MAAPVQDAIVVFGDSLTQGGWESYGFTQRLAHDYARKLDVINRGLGGYNTEWALPVLEHILTPATERKNAPIVRILTIWFGANDSCISPSRQHISLERFSANLEQMISMVSNPESKYYSPETHILLLTPPPINTFQRGPELESRNPPRLLDREFDVTAKYAQAVRDVGSKHTLPVVDVYKALWDAVGHEEKALNKYLSDGLHLTADGYTIVYDEIMKTISQKLPKLHYDNLQQVFTPWDEVDVSNVAGSVAKRNIFK
ncbi:SGNH hydrolase [Rickenella mellea]|uniref:SGNH hydrolase n=1 Tax=Rickenella mellea TaxID=50990 RepID=A0A4Y7QIY3_9AGAM|nr:SGNH hydrolase [Rickenella mellea]